MFVVTNRGQRILTCSDQILCSLLLTANILDLSFDMKRLFWELNFPKLIFEILLYLALQYQKTTYNSQLVKAVNFVFEALQPNVLKFVWITLQACKFEVIKKFGWCRLSHSIYE